MSRLDVIDVIQVVPEGAPVLLLDYKSFEFVKLYHKKGSGGDIMVLVLKDGSNEIEVESLTVANIADLYIVQPELVGQKVNISVRKDPDGSDYEAALNIGYLWFD